MQHVPLNIQRVFLKSIIGSQTDTAQVVNMDFD